MSARRSALVGVAVVCCVSVGLGWWSKAHCLTDGGWSDGEEYLSACYTDLYPLWFAERLNEGAVPYLDHPVEYPVLTGVQMLVVQQVVQVADEADRPVWFFHVTAVVNALLALGVLGLLAAAGLPPRRLLWWAVAPPLVVYVALNWDPLAIALMVAAIVLHLRDRDLEAGVAAGLGVAAKLLPGLVIPFIVAARLAQGRPRDALRHGGGALVACAAVNLPVALVAPEGWSRFFELNSERPSDFNTLWFLAEQIRGAPFAVSTVNTASLALFVAGGLVIGVVGGRNRDPGDWWSLTLPVLCWFLLTNKVYSPQYSLWLLPLAALSLRRFAPYAAFLVTDVMVYFVLFPYLWGYGGGEPAPAYRVLAVAVLARAGMLAWILVESVLDHDHDLTATTGRPAPRASPRLVDRVPADGGQRS